MKKLMRTIVGFALSVLLLSGCSPTPSQPESVAPCLPGIAWGMTEDEVCAALGWNKADVTIYDNETTGPYHIYGKDDIELWGIPCGIALWESWGSGATSVHMKFSKEKLDAVLALLEEQGFSLKENPSQPGVWNQQGDYLFQFCSEEEFEEILQYRMRYWEKNMDFEARIEIGPYKTKEELVAYTEKDMRKEMQNKVMYSVKIRPVEEGESCILDMYGTHSAILNRIRASQE